ncbi:hypothetical protein GCM10011348_28510 [Marinobacterium nitratireducens]|uniref:Uncharacterized protein n=1 Tax=Marinobacterium nitratireducens TaxID=518897 RepID=A0A917ZI86_9GAMM|nr:ParA family protein [Marinobacterium nitratireducens]GGO83810.1 hypothetical protein GCM10011348_28510 [Marinobacterium nitratireducens]
MGRIVVFASGSKGGVGKSATAANLCGALAFKGYSVALVDTDTGLRDQGNNGTRTASNWCAARNYLIEQEGQPYVEVTSYMLSPEEKIHSQLMELAKTNDYVVVDTPGSAHTALRSAILVADVIYLPMNCSRAEFMPLSSFFGLISEVEELLEMSGNARSIDARLLPIRIPANWRPDNTEFYQWFSENAAPYASLSSVKIPFIKVLCDSVGQGWSLHDVKDKKRASFDLLIDEINGTRGLMINRGVEEGSAV